MQRYTLPSLARLLFEELLSDVPQRSPHNLIHVQTDIPLLLSMEFLEFPNVSDRVA